MFNMIIVIYHTHIYTYIHCMSYIHIYTCSIILLQLECTASLFSVYMPKNTYRLLCCQWQLHCLLHTKFQLSHSVFAQMSSKLNGWWHTCSTWSLRTRKERMLTYGMSERRWQGRRRGDESGDDARVTRRWWRGRGTSARTSDEAVMTTIEARF